MKNNSIKSSAVMPVSAKYYARLQQRVNSIITDLHLTDGNGCVTSVMEYINRYFEKVDSASMDQAVSCDNSRGESDAATRIAYVIFLTLRAEIDTAIARSRRAREAAARRRALREASSQSLSDVTATIPAEEMSPAAMSQLSRTTSHNNPHPKTYYHQPARTLRCGLKATPIVQRHQKRRARW